MSEEEKKVDRVGSKANWYKGSVEYWNTRPATVDGVLGGYETIHHTDSDTSNMMIEEQKERISGFDEVLDCGAGIGRISKATLKPYFDKVDLLEPAAVQLEQAKTYFPEGRNFYCAGMQEFEYETKYDAVWI